MTGKPGSRIESESADRDWMTHAACRGHDPETWFPAPTDHETRRNAEKICFDCPVVDACRDYALRTESHHGVWGGEWFSERLSYRSPGRPHKPHGTTAAARQHQRLGQKPCDECRQAVMRNKQLRKERQ